MSHYKYRKCLILPFVFRWPPLRKLSTLSKIQKLTMLAEEIDTLLSGGNEAQCMETHASHRVHRAKGRQVGEGAQDPLAAQEACPITAQPYMAHCPHCHLQLEDILWGSDCTCLHHLPRKHKKQ